MALYWQAKAPASVEERLWRLEGVSSATLTVTTGTATVTHEVTDEGVLATVTGGAAGVVQIIAASAVLGSGETISETIYLPIRDAANLLGNTVYDVCAFALRKIAGIGEGADADELDVAVEILNDMFADWRATGADVGIAKELASTDDLIVRDEFIAPIKYNLTFALAEEFDRPITPFVVERARRGLGLIKSALLSRDTLQAEYY